MTAQKGSLVLLKVGNGGGPETFTTIGGLRTTGFTYNNQSIDAANREAGAWRQLVDGVGARSISISGTGAFTNSATEETVRGIAMNNQVRNYQITFGNGDSMAGPFQITAYSRTGNYTSEEMYSITLASAGTIVFTHV